MIVVIGTETDGVTVAGGMVGVSGGDGVNELSGCNLNYLIVIISN